MGGIFSIPIPQHVGSSLGIITSSGWPFVSAVLGQMAHLVASITLDSARSYVMQSAFLTQGTVSTVVGVSVTVVVIVESSSVVKLSFVIT
ncbi:hypothetical protein Tco_0031741 [Tanacetum coccineum]